MGAGPSGVCQTVPKCFSLEDEKARKTRLAQERRAKIMAQMSALQKAFIKENAELLASMESKEYVVKKIGELVSKEMVCCVCGKVNDQSKVSTLWLII